MSRPAFSNALALLGAIALLFATLGFSARPADAAGEVITISDATVGGQAPACLSDTTLAIFIVTIQPVPTTTITVQYATQNDTAFAGVDYQSNSGVLIFNPGVHQQTIVVAVHCDAPGTPDQRFRVVLTEPSGGALLGDSEGVGLILGDLPLISIEPAIAAEGNSGQTAMNFVIRLSRAVAGPVTVDFATGATSISRPATPGLDYVAVVAGPPAGRLTIPAGATTGVATVQVIGDTLVEGLEVFEVTLSNPLGGGLINNGQPTNNGISAIGIIDDEEIQPTLSLHCPETVTEGDLLSCSATLSAPVGQTVTAQFRTIDDTATSTPPNADYAAAPPTSITFRPGEPLTQNLPSPFPLAIFTDGLEETGEAFQVQLFNIQHAAAGQTGATITIQDRMRSPVIQLEPAELVEPDSGTAAMAFIVALVGGVSQQAVTVNYTTVTASGPGVFPATGGATPGAGIDYLAGSGSVVIAPGATSATILIPVAGDTIDEEDERFNLTLTSTTPAIPLSRNTASGTIIDNDLPPTVGIGDARVNEPDSGTATAAFTVSLGAASGKTVTVTYATADGASPNGATAPADYLAAGGTLTFAPGETSRTINIVITSDNLVEQTETFLVNLTGAINATLPAGTRGVGTIIDDGNGGPTDCVQFVAHVNYPDGTAVDANQSFEKRWRLRNCGVAWGDGYRAVRIEGSYGPAAFEVRAAAGATVEVGATFSAPSTAGVYRATYRLEGPGGQFGDSFQVEVRVRSVEQQLYSISGRVRAGERGLAGVRVTASNNAGVEVSAVSGSNGHYSISGLAAGSYSLFAEHEEYEFGPPRQVNLSRDLSDQHFTARDDDDDDEPEPDNKVAVIVYGSSDFNIGIAEQPDQGCIATLLTDPGYPAGRTGEEITDWRAIGKALLDAGYEVYLIDWSARPPDDAGIAAAAEDCLASQLAALAGRDRENGKVVLVSHSIGGLVSRAYIEGDGYRGDVEALVTMGTPHVGITFAALLNVATLFNPGADLVEDFICRRSPGFCQLGTEGMLWFNAKHQPRADVPYLFIGGAGASATSALLNGTEGGNDGLVGFRSATGYQYGSNGNLPTIGKPPGNGILVVRGATIVRRYSDSSHGGVPFASQPWYFDDPAVHGCVIDFLAKSHNRPEAACGNVRAAGGLPTEGESAAAAYTPTVFGTLSSGEIVTATLDLDGTRADIFLGASNGRLSLSLTMPDGRTLTPLNAAQLLAGARYQGPVAAGDPSISAYQLPNPPAGRWVATLAASDVVSETSFALFGVLQSPLALQVEHPGSLDPGQPFQVNVTISKATTMIDGATVSARLPLESGVQEVRLTQTAPGRYSGRLRAPEGVGLHLLTITARGYAGTAFARQALEMVSVRAGGVQRVGQVTVTPVGRDRNGRYRMLRVTADYMVTTAGDYGALATLQDASGRAITITRAMTSWTNGLNRIVFDFDGGEIRSSGIDGPYRVVSQIVTAEGLQLAADEQPLISGLNYRAADFAPSLQETYLPLFRQTDQ